ncbi:MAG: DUF1727 domain-containing protein [Chloroflexi bacterium]|nr:DUF1727 domain-containing protein [Chloroflexota bacterium]
MGTTSVRERAAVLAGRAAGAAARTLRLGGGTALPGLVAARIAPDLVERLAAGLRAGTVTVTGTNGKTTTAHLLSAIARHAGMEVVANRSGSNLERGVIATFVESKTPSAGEAGVAERRLGVLEIDEAAWPSLASRLRPRVAVFLNLFRDQLDRYGEVDSVAEGWRAGLRALASGAGSGATLVLNADDPSVAQLAEAWPHRVLAFGVDDPRVALPAPEHAADARFCVCGARFAYDAVHVAHVGRWRCTRCGRARPARDVAALAVETAGEGARARVAVGGREVELALPLAGLYSVYNALAAVAAASALGVAPSSIAEALAHATPAFGRQETFDLDGRRVRVLLAKNPAGLNEVVRTLETAGPPLRLLALLNDGIQDGRDVSWIYDADVERLAPLAPTLVCSGDRADDLALRFALAGVEPAVVERDVERALDRALEATPAGARLEVVPTYTAMLRVREVLARRSGRRPYWAGERS